MDLVAAGHAVRERRGWVRGKTVVHLTRGQKADGSGSGIHRDFWAGDKEARILGVAQVWQSAHDDLHRVRGHSGKKAAQDRVLPVGQAEERASHTHWKRKRPSGDPSARFSTAKEEERWASYQGKSGREKCSPGGEKPGQLVNIEGAGRLRACRC